MHPLQYPLLKTSILKLCDLHAAIQILTQDEDKWHITMEDAKGRNKHSILDRSYS